MALYQQYIVIRNWNSPDVHSCYIVYTPILTSSGIPLLSFWFMPSDAGMNGLSIVPRCQLTRSLRSPWP